MRGPRVTLRRAPDRPHCPLVQSLETHGDKRADAHRGVRGGASEEELQRRRPVLLPSLSSLPHGS
ncbi:Hypothetical predicted protein [Xyrichtys novacula]|uniref:Uncharacterized protein n=1 Tax=Xyrichtys novacula TaxID=13765 RepID=A0AAV1FUQ8_XYRNO|nr:Hypothetical predicted protein [Xyrichtys novacula]